MFISKVRTVGKLLNAGRGRGSRSVSRGFGRSKVADLVLVELVVNFLAQGPEILRAHSRLPRPPLQQLNAQIYLTHHSRFLCVLPLRWQWQSHAAAALSHS